MNSIWLVCCFFLLLFVFDFHGFWYKRIMHNWRLNNLFYSTPENCLLSRRYVNVGAEWGLNWLWNMNYQRSYAHTLFVVTMTTQIGPPFEMLGLTAVLCHYLMLRALWWPFIFTKGTRWINGGWAFLHLHKLLVICLNQYINTALLGLCAFVMTTRGQNTQEHQSTKTFPNRLQFIM